MKKTQIFLERESLTLSLRRRPARQTLSKALHLSSAAA